MNLLVEFLPLQQLIWGAMHDSAQSERALSDARAVAVEFLSGLGWPLLVVVILFILAFRFYSPRIPRGGFWTPAFGLFGGAPKLYLHTRPASVGGIFLKSRHRVFTVRRRERKH